VSASSDKPQVKIFVLQKLLYLTERGVPGPVQNKFIMRSLYSQIDAIKTQKGLTERRIL